MTKFRSAGFRFDLATMKGETQISCRQARHLRASSGQDSRFSANSILHMILLTALPLLATVRHFVMCPGIRKPCSVSGLGRTSDGHRARTQANMRKGIVFVP